MGDLTRHGAFRPSPEYHVFTRVADVRLRPFRTRGGTCREACLPCSATARLSRPGPRGESLTPSRAHPLMDACPSSTQDGCKCPLHAEGLMAYARDKDAYEAVLARVREWETRPLRVVTTEPQIACTGALTCECPACEKDRQAAVRRGSRDTAQPWDVRRRRAA